MLVFWSFGRKYPTKWFPINFDLLSHFSQFCQFSIIQIEALQMKHMLCKAINWIHHKNVEKKTKMKRVLTIFPAMEIPVSMHCRELCIFSLYKAKHNQNQRQFDKFIIMLTSQQAHSGHDYGTLLSHSHRNGEKERKIP